MVGSVADVSVAQEPWIVRAFYGFAPFADFRDHRDPIRDLCEVHGLIGTILLAHEGINGTVAGQVAGLDRLFVRLRSIPGFEGLTYKESHSQDPPFHRLKVRLKNEIVSIGEPSVDPTRTVGTYVAPEQWDEVLRDPEVVVIDTRNDYEVRVGSFEGAVDPGLQSFRDFPAWARANLDPDRNRKVAMFCTGGIRCEKASSFLLDEGFSEVLHLQGGILEYLRRVDPRRSSWNGECFVFDDRVALDHELRRGTHVLCFGCKDPVSPLEQASEHFEYGVSCPRCHHLVDDETRARRRERTRQIELARERGEQHLGARHPSEDSPNE